MRVLLVTDAWYPQVNGVVRTLTQMRDQLQATGTEVAVLGPEGTTVSCPTYPEIRLTLNPKYHIYQLLSAFSPHAIHIATEGPLGWAMRSICRQQGWPFTTSFHTRFPEYIKTRLFVPRRWTYHVLRRFHQRAERVLVPTQSVKDDLVRLGLANVQVWGRGVDTELFTPDLRKPLPYSGPVQLYVGRIAPEKNLHAFLDSHVPGTKILVGDGPDRASLQNRYPEAVFLGPLFGRQLAEIYASADVFVFPSRTDTFGLVLLESLASGTPAAAFPTSGPMDVLTDPESATLSEDLSEAIRRSLTLNRNNARRFALRHSWKNCAEIFRHALVPLREAINLDAEIGSARSSSRENRNLLRHNLGSLYYSRSQI